MLKTIFFIRRVEQFNKLKVFTVLNYHKQQIKINIPIFQQGLDFNF